MIMYNTLERPVRHKARGDSTDAAVPAQVRDCASVSRLALVHICIPSGLRGGGTGRVTAVDVSVSNAMSTSERGMPVEKDSTESKEGNIPKTAIRSHKERRSECA